MPVIRLPRSQPKEDTAAFRGQFRAPKLENGFFPGCSTSSPGASGYIVELGIVVFSGHLHRGLLLKEENPSPQSYRKLRMKYLDLLL